LIDEDAHEGEESALRKTYQVLLAVLVGLVGSVTLGGPAHAATADAYYGNRGHAWSNIAGTRVGVEDQRDDGIEIFAEISIFGPVGPNNTLTLRTYDRNDSNPGRSVFVVPSGWVLWEFRVCGILNGHEYSDVRGCGGAATSR
jgi:hypothetical protein